MADYLMLFSISPVQDFISNSRKTQDLYNGSKILSELTKSQLELLQQEDSVEIIFPNPDSDSLPNRFVARISGKDEEEIKQLGKKLEDNYESMIYETTLNSVNKYNDHLHQQVTDYFLSFWSAVKIESSYAEAYQELERKHAGTKNLRMFQQLGDGKGEQGRKCSLCGEYNALIYKEKRPAFLSENAITVNSNSIKSGEAICGVCAIKRFNSKKSFPSTAEISLLGTISKNEFELLKQFDLDPQELYKENRNEDYLKKNQIDLELEKIEEIPNEQILKRAKLKDSDLPKYYALIMYDGDNMGKLLSGSELKEDVNLQNFHQELAKSLSSNAKESSKIVEQAGKTVYAGGDDFLGFCTLDKLLPTLKNLRECFDEQVNHKLLHYLKPSSAINMSAGVVIAHYKTPLHIVLNWARKMEQESKNNKGKNSVTLAVLKHSGDIQKVTWNWGDIIDKMKDILDQLKSNKFSTNFIYTLDEEFRKLDYEADESYDRQFDSELKRLIKRSRIDKNSKNTELNTQLHKACLDLEYSFNNIEDYFSLMRIIAFLYRESGGEK